jgi:hypothetical protein
MTPRRLGAFVLSILFVASSALAVEIGKADGTVTINRKPVKLKYAFAKKEKDYEKNDRYVVILTDRAVSRTLLDDVSRFAKAVEKGEVVAAKLQFDNTKKLAQIEVDSKVLQNRSMPVMTEEVKLAGVAFSNDAIAGSAATTADQNFFTDVATLDVKFNAPLGLERFGENAPAAKELAASGPQIADGGAIGTLKVDGSTVKLTHSIARLTPNAFDEKKKDVEVLLTDQPVATETFIDNDKLYADVKNGKLLGLVVKIDSDEKPYHLQLLHPKTPMQLSGTGFFNFDAIDFSEKHAAGHLFSNGEEDFMGKHKYSYDVSFAVPVQMIAIPSELTLDASSGKKLPAGGGEPGKAYMSFDKAARGGNLNDMKKLASKSRPLPDMKPEEMKQMIELMKLMRPAKVKVLGGFVSGDHATLSVEGEEPSDKKKATGTIEMGLEDGTWKLLAEKWSS